MQDTRKVTVVDCRHYLAEETTRLDKVSRGIMVKPSAIVHTPTAVRTSFSFRCSCFAM